MPTTIEQNLLALLSNFVAMLSNPLVRQAIHTPQPSGQLPTLVQVASPQDRKAERNKAIAQGFARKGIKVAFDTQTGRFDNVKPYNVWLAEGFQVRKGEHGVRGLFHLSQCDKVPTPDKPTPNKPRKSKTPLQPVA